MFRSLGAVVVALALPAAGQNTFSLTGIVPQQGPPTALLVNYSGPYPANPSPYLDKKAWRVWVTRPGQSKAEEINVDAAAQAVDSQGFRLGKLSLTLSGDIPAAEKFPKSTWRAQFSPDKASGIEGTEFDFVPASGANQTPLNSGCDPKSTAHYFCAPASGATPDFSLSGTFTAAGGTKPLYQFQLQGGVYTETEYHALWGFRPGVTTNTQINQDATTPVNRTTFDPDSITAGIAFQKLKVFEKPVADLSGIQFDETLPGGEFTRKDPTSNIIVTSTALFALRPFTAPGHLTYGTLYPVMGMEVGKNLNRPRELDSIPVDLSHYNAIVRGVLGANASIARKSSDKSTDVLSLVGTYRVRLPVHDEPLVKTLHQVTTVELTTRARHWIEVDGSVTPWSFKYLALTAKYQYGELPPAFNFVDHSFTLGLTLKAVQSNKPNVGTAP